MYVIIRFLEIEIKEIKKDSTIVLIKFKFEKSNGLDFINFEELYNQL